MKKRFQQRIGVKLFFLLSGLVILAIIPLAAIVFSTLNEFSEQTELAGRQEENRRTYSYLSTITRERAHHYDSFLSQVESAVSLMAAQVGEVYSDPQNYGLPPVVIQEELEQLQWGLPLYKSHDVSTVFRSDARMNGETKEELMALIHLDPVLKGAQGSISSSASTHLITVSGICRYFRSDLQAMGKSLVRDRNPLLYPEIQRVFAKLEKQHRFDEDTVAWTRVYRDRESGRPLLTGLSPVVDGSGTFRGVVGMDISLVGEIDYFYRSAMSEASWAGDNLFTFLIRGSGEIVAFPERYRELFGLPGASSAEDERGVLLEHSRHPVVVDAATRLNEPMGAIVEIGLDGKNYIMSSHKLHKLGWSLVQVNNTITQASLTEKTRKALSGTIADLASHFVVLGIVTLLVTFLIVYYAVQYFVGPLINLTQTAEKVGRGDLQVRFQVEREDELGVLATSFNNMVSRLQAVEEEKRQEALWLEGVVRERTMDLQQKNIVLHDLIEELRQTETELLESQSMLRESLDEKEVLLREIYHRTKNNMLVIISMLQLQAMEVDDRAVETLFKEMENRIRAMSLVHEKLYQSKNLTDIELGQYLKEMVTSLVESMVRGNHITVDCDCERVRVSIDSAVPLGLAINEIVTNSLKHAFGDMNGNRQGRVFVRLRMLEGDVVEIVVGDDGEGMQQGIDPTRARSLGMQITTNLIKGQLRGDIEMIEGAGVVYRLTFTDQERSRRV